MNRLWQLYVIWIWMVGFNGCAIINERILEARKPNQTPSKFIRPDLASNVSRGNSPTLLLFIHGIFGDTINTWRHEKREKALFDLLLEEKEFSQGYDVYAFGYPSDAVKAGSFSIHAAALNLKSEFEYRKFAENYRDIVIVAHSMGGLVALEFLTLDASFRDKVPLVITYATPYNGAQVANLAKDLLDNPALSDMALRDSRNTFLDSLTNRWKLLKQKASVQCAYETVGFPWFGVIVPHTSAEGLCDGVATPIADDHIGVIKPTDSNHGSLKVLVNALRTMRKTQDKPFEIIIPRKPGPQILRFESLTSDKQSLGLLRLRRGNVTEDISLEVKPLIHPDHGRNTCELAIPLGREDSIKIKTDRLGRKPWPKLANEYSVVLPDGSLLLVEILFEYVRWGTGNAKDQVECDFSVLVERNHERK